MILRLLEYAQGSYQETLKVVLMMIGLNLLNLKIYSIIVVIETYFYYCSFSSVIDY